MNEVIIEASVSAPSKPGVYKMLNKERKALYVGKALNLKKRLNQYRKPLCNRLQLMMNQVCSIETIVTTSELEALILESELIKFLKPKYNILLKDDKSFTFIKITDDPYSRITKYRGQYTSGSYGPFFSSLDAKNSIKSIQEAFLLRSCSNQTFQSRSRPCLEYQIKRCSAPCTGKISEEQYQKAAAQAHLVLSGKAQAVQKQLMESMQKSSKEQKFEKAAIYRDRIRSLQNVSIYHPIMDSHILGVHEYMEFVIIKVFIVKNNQRIGDPTYFFNKTMYGDFDVILNSFLMQYCGEHKVEDIFLEKKPSCNCKRALEELYGTKIHCPKKESELKMLKLANDNAREALNQKISLQLKNEREMQKLAAFFELSKTPERIEVYDNSHISGSDAVGVIVVMTRTGFSKAAYRKFNIKTSKNCDDYAMLREVLSRRFTANTNIPPNPDFILIDGGIGQLSTVRSILEPLKIPFACISKGEKRKLGEETIHTIKSPFIKLPANDSLLYFLQILCDEAHRFAITSHRNKRLTHIKQSTLDLIPGIGEKKKKILLTCFKSIHKLRQANMEQLIALPGIDKKIATKIIEHLKNS